MWKLKGCPRCKGDIFLDGDKYGWYEQCLQCGYSRDLETVVEVRQQVAEREKEGEAKRAGLPKGK
jgi:hypothetical protein